MPKLKQPIGLKRIFGLFGITGVNSAGTDKEVLLEDDGTIREQLVLWDTTNTEQIRAAATTEGALKVFLVNLLGQAALGTSADFLKPLIDNLQDVVIQLKILNIHMTKVTDEHFLKEADIKEDR